MTTMSFMLLSCGRAHHAASFSQFAYAIWSILSIELDNSEINYGSMQIDDTDRKILALLRENARAPSVELARRAGISRTTLQARMERLERAKIIAGYTIRGDSEHDRQAIRAHIMITAVPKLAPSVETALRKIPDVRTLHSVSGTFDMVAVAVTES